MEPNAPVAQMQNIDGPVALFGFGWKLFTNHWKILTPILVLPTILRYAGTLLLRPHQPALNVISILLTIVSVALSIAMGPAAVDAVHRIVTGSSAGMSLKSQYKIGFGYFWSALLLGIIFGCALVGGGMLFIIPGVIIGIYGSFYIYCLVIDGKRGFSAFTESYSLVRGRWGAVVGRTLFLGLIVLGGVLVVLGLGFLIGLATGMDVSFVAQPGAAPSLAVQLITFVLNLILISIISPIAIGYTYRMYASLKATRQPEAPVKTFKGWLIAFMILGPIAFILIAGVGIAAVALNSLHEARMNAPQVNSASTTVQYSGTNPEAGTTTLR